MSIRLPPQSWQERIVLVFLGVVLAGAFFSYGAYSLIQASCTLVGRGNPPYGTFVTFHGLEARLLSTIYLGGGIWLFADRFLYKQFGYPRAKALSWLGAVTLLFGMCSLVVILFSPLFS